MHWLCLVLLVLLSRAVLVQAGEVELVKTTFTQRGDTWDVSTTLRHDDTGWEQYADAWRVVTADGKVLGTRVLYHPHEHEQPFTRSLGGVKIPTNLEVVFVEAHCKVHGWSSQRLRVDLRQKAGERFQVHR
jgi:hypothetical protein